MLDLKFHNEVDPFVFSGPDQGIKRAGVRRRRHRAAHHHRAQSASKAERQHGKLRISGTTLKVKPDPVYPSFVQIENF